MGKAEGEFRGGEDVVLKAAIEACTEEEWELAKVRMQEEGLFEKEYDTKMQAIMDLEQMNGEIKKDIADQLKEGTFVL